MRLTIPLVALIGGLALAVLAVLTLQRPPIHVEQDGYRGTGIQLISSPAATAAAFAINQAPEALPQNNAGPPAGSIYKNVQVLKNVPAGAFARIMVSMTQWVAPKQGCGYCHVSGNFASDAKYTKRVARRMIQMTIYTNAVWKSHVKNVGVTCYTCHRGNNNPQYVWFKSVEPPHATGLMATETGEARPSLAADGSALPYDPFTPFLVGKPKGGVNAMINTAGTTALPDGNRMSIQQTNWTYALMMNFATSLGVNCEFCHESRNFGSWSESTPKRVTAYYGLHMVRGLNNNYMVPLTATFAHNLLGPSGDVAKVDCSTCHQGLAKPLYGAQMAKAFPYLQGPATLADASPTSPAASGEADPAMITMTSAPAAAAPASAAPAPAPAGQAGK
ncbi:MAG: photosynthetic reaction center cytochrome c subunit [Proteobacteria bacterium]|jgi:photosynthetic reaction center cytochrome c subunit|nr:photosynthetic reaction center cytochrome c subunit [Pseudomonadota bacterium]